MSDSELWSNWIQHDLISILVNFSCQLGQIMTRYDFQEARWVISSNDRTNYNFTCFHSYELGQIMARYVFLGWMSDFEQCSNQFQLELISLLVNFSYELRQRKTKYDFLEARWMILSNVRPDSNLTWLHSSFHIKWGQIMTRYDFLEPRRSTCHVNWGK